MLGIECQLVVNEMLGMSNEAAGDRQGVGSSSRRAKVGSRRSQAASALAISNAEMGIESFGRA